MPGFALADWPQLDGGGVIDPNAVFDNIFNFVWPLFTIVAILFFIVAGYLFLSANGDAAKVKTAKSALLWGIAGVVVAILAFSIPTIIAGILGA